MHVATTCLKTGQSGIPAELTALDSETSLLLLFGDSRLIDRPALIQQVLDACPRSHVMGCSTAGEIHGCEISDDSLVVAAARFDHTALRTAQATVQAPTDSYTAGRTIAEQLTHSSLRGVFVLSDGLNVNGSELVKGLNDTLGEAVVVTGGLAGDGTDFKRTWVIKDRMPIGGYVTAIGFYGDHVKLGHGSKGGWDKFGPERLVTKSKGNILYELDGRPALQLYKEYLGDRAAGLPATGLLFPLAIRSSNTDGKALVRTILAVDEAAQSMTFAGDMPEGVLAQLMRANFDRLVQGASDAATLAVNSRDHTSSPSPTLSIAISCVGRRLVLGERTEEEIEATLDILPKGSSQVGFYSYGEISPYKSGACDLHNQTMTLTTIAEF
ncbi:MAG: FIST C-terminal domain-containing protein [Nitrospira sp.]|nr:FIST C-terminal domain-containing protein [Nitrospira sp.]MBS0172532.1 FIST C-terminal domain-containing protein [Nitrospira sp.]MBX3337671.1 FIST C-terminal domain-containing protein [Nitrospira sp.]MCW5778072.1 FIST C-terminal domain-containing protein [Nitrospira sp.]HNL88263.1 FIST N-terminal domain-containing protein [Nitrospira sp.]